MPIDPTIAAGVQQLQPPQNNALLAQGVQPIQLRDPLEQYSNMLRAQYMGSQNTLNQQEIARTSALNHALAMPGAVNPDGTMNLETIRQGLGTEGGSAFPGLAKSAMEMQAQMATMHKTNVDAATAQIKNYMQQYSHINPNDPNSLQQAIGIHNAMHSDPVTGSFLAGIGADADGGVQRATDLYTASKGWDESKQGPSPWSTYLKTQAQPPEQLYKMERPTLVNQGGHQTLVQTHAYDTGAPPTVAGVFQNSVSPDAALASATSRANNAATNQTTLLANANSVQGAQQRSLAEQANTQLKTYLPAAQGATANIAQINKALDLLSDPQAITGAGSGFRTQVARVLDAMGVKSTGTATTQELVKLLANQTMAQAGTFKAEGAGFRQMAGPELAFMSGATPTQQMTPEGIRMMLNLNKKQQLFQANLYNTNRAAYAQKVPEQLLLAPQVDVRPEARPEDLAGPTTKNIAFLKANPGTAAQFDQIFGRGASAQILGGQ